MYQIMSKDTVAAVSKRYFVRGQNEEAKQNKKWLGRDNSQAIQLYESASAWGHEEARRRVEELRSKK
jgi:hypothetical protein